MGHGSFECAKAKQSSGGLVSPELSGWGSIRASGWAMSWHVYLYSTSYTGCTFLTCSQRGALWAWKSGSGSLTLACMRSIWKAHRLLQDISMHQEPLQRSDPGGLRWSANAFLDDAIALVYDHRRGYWYARYK